MDLELQAIHQGACLILARYMDQEAAGGLSPDTPWDEYRKNSVLESIQLLRLAKDLRGAQSQGAV